MTLGKRLVQLRRKNQWSQQELASKLNISRASYSQYEIDQREPSLETLAKISDVYDVSLDFLICGSSKPFKSVNEISSVVELIEDFVGVNFFSRIMSLSTSGRMHLLREFDVFTDLELERESERS